MKNYLNKILVLFIFLLFVQKISANAAQPGIWNAGGTVFTMMYPEDSATFKKVQMQQEKIYMQIYPGFAVVKGWYKMKNTSKTYLKFKMGYPVNGIYYGGANDLNEVHLDSLSQFKIYSNQRELPLIKTKPNIETVQSINAFSDNWLVWDINFLPDETKIIEVYFLVETNNGKITKGYNADSYNAFIYLVESGNIWKNPIEKGEFYVQMMQGLQEKNIHGISNGFGFLWNKNLAIAKGIKTNFSPTQKDNLIITYSERNENFKFSDIVSQKEKWYAAIDQFSKIAAQESYTEKFLDKNPYEVSTSVLSYFPMILMAVIMFLPYLLIGALVFIVVILIIKKRKKRNQ